MRTNKDCHEIMQALSDKNRYQIIQLLAKSPLNVQQLEKKLNLNQSLLSHQLKLLRDYKLVQAERSGRNMIYSLTNISQKSADKLELNLDCCQLNFNLNERNP